MSDAEIQQVAVVGGGTMGNGIAHVLARHGFDVVLCESDQGALDRARATIENNLAREVAKAKIDDATARQALGRIRGTLNLDDAASAELVIEAIPENRVLKQDLFRRLDGILGPAALIASNTSSISITELAAATKRPDRCLGLHFMNPVPIMRLVELIRGLATSDATAARAQHVVHRMDKTPVEVRDFPGFVSNRVLMPMINEAIYCVMESVAKPDAIDEILKLGMAHPMGPLTLADFIGLDVCLNTLEVMHQGLGDPKFRPCPLLRQMVAAGWLGRKSGRGFYQY